MKMFSSLGAKLMRQTSASAVVSSIVLEDDVVYLQGITKDERSLAPSGVIRGTVSLKVKGIVNVLAVKLVLSGIFARSDVLKGGGKRLIENSTEFISEELSLLESQGLDFTLSEDKSITIPFNLIVAPEWPESIYTNYGSVIYKCRLFVKYSDGEFYKNSKISESVDTKIIKVLRTALDTSCLSAEFTLVQGNWKDKISYRINISKKYARIGESVDFDISLTPSCDSNYRVKSLKTTLVQVIALNATKSNEDCEKFKYGKYNQVERVVLKNHIFTQKDQESNGDIKIKWSSLMEPVFMTAFPSLKLFPYTSQLDLDPAVPNLKILHKFKISFELEEIETPSHTKSHYSSTAASSNSRFTSSTFGDSMITFLSNTLLQEASSLKSSNALNSRVQLTLTAPVYLLHQDSNLEIPPRYTASEYSIGSKELKKSHHASSFCLHRGPHHKGSTNPFLVTAEPHFNTQYQPETKPLKSNSWYDLVKRWDGQAPPNYSTN